jgi:hypothetical protein
MKDEKHLPTFYLQQVIFKKPPQNFQNLNRNNKNSYISVTPPPKIIKDQRLKKTHGICSPLVHHTFPKSGSIQVTT